MDVPFLVGKMASCEVIIAEFWKILEPKVKQLQEGSSLHKLTLYETPRNFVEYYG